MKLRKSAIVGGFVVAVAGLAGAYWAGRASAVGAPTATPLTYAGVLTDANGTPLAGRKNLQLQLFDAATAGTSLCSMGPTPFDLVAGSFQITLSDPCVAALRGAPDAWLEVFVDGTSMGRTKVGAVPYALEASRATSAGGPLDLRLGALEGQVAHDPAGKALRICSGSTPVGSTAWVDYNGQIQVDIDTSGCHFTTRPTYITSLNGKTNHWTVTGGSEPYVADDAAALKGFSIYINAGTGGVTPTVANQRGWSVSWIAVGN